MKTFEFDCDDVNKQVKICYSMVCQEMKANPAFDDIMHYVISSVCPEDYDDSPKHIKIEVSDDQKRLVVSNYRRDERLLDGMTDNCFVYCRTTLELAPDGNIHIIASNNKAFPLKEYESKYSSLGNYKIKMPYTSSEYPAIYSISSIFHAFDNQGIEISYSKYKDLCPRKDTNFDDFIEESIKRCPTEWHLNDYPSGIKEGTQEYYPHRSYFCRCFNRFGIMCGHEKGYTKEGFDEVLTQYVCDDRFPNQLPEITYICELFSKTVNGIPILKPEDYVPISGLDEETLKFRLNADFIRNMENQLNVTNDDERRILLLNSIRSAKQCLIIENETPEKADQEPNPMRL